MEYEQRHELRKQKLKELYEYHYENDGGWKNVIDEVKDTETHLAYKYLGGKGLIEYKEKSVSGGIFFADAQINPIGIDLVETNRDIR